VLLITTGNWRKTTFKKNEPGFLIMSVYTTWWESSNLSYAPVSVGLFLGQVAPIPRQSGSTVARITAPQSLRKTTNATSAVLIRGDTIQIWSVVRIPKSNPQMIARGRAIMAAKML